MLRWMFKIVYSILCMFLFHFMHVLRVAYTDVCVRYIIKRGQEIGFSSKVHNLSRLSRFFGA